LESILLINWDNYPNSPHGGIYPWAKSLVENLSEFQYIMINCLSNPNTNSQYVLPLNVRRVLEIPLYGCHRYQEYYNDEEDNTLLPRILRTTDTFVSNTFIPIFSEFISQLVSEKCNHKQLSQIVYDLHHLLTKFDAKKCAEHPLTFSTFLEQITKDDLYVRMPLQQATFIFQIVQRMLQILSVKLPKVNLIHSSNAWLPAMMGIGAKIESNCPMIVTEHGLAFKDLLLYHRLFVHDAASQIFWNIFSSNIIRTVYEIADILAPVSYANAISEESLCPNVKRKIRVIYPGVDPMRFRPDDHSENELRLTSIHSYNTTTSADHIPTVVYVGRIEILKDLITLFLAIKHVKEQIPNIVCLVYGSSTDIDYANLCLKVVSELGLQDNIKFMGGTKYPEKAYNSGDVVVLSSIREGFPYIIVEAMSCGKAIVSTDVGGVREALENCGVLVRSLHAHSLADEIAKLLTNTGLRRDLGNAARNRVLKKFTVEKSIEEYRQLYSQMIDSGVKPDTSPALGSFL
jgi:glycosyltransferase involved in cell wall biosynthesis